MLFERQHMAGNSYNWDEDEKKFSGEPTRRLFDRFNGNQVLFIINYYAAKVRELTLTEFRDIEHKIINNLPFHTLSEISVFNWINEPVNPGR